MTTVKRNLNKMMTKCNVSSWMESWNRKQILTKQKSEQTMDSS